jgi:predicted dehydrogenase
MAKTYRVAVIGRTGRGNYGHSIDVAWKTHPRAQIAGIADDDAAGLAKAGERLGCNILFADYRKMLAEVRPDIVLICPRWVDGHLEMALAAADARASIFMEKPMARTLAECDRIIDACDRAHTRISVAHNNRVCPIIDHVEQRVRDGLIGDLQEIRGRGKEDRRAGGEDLMVLGTHVFDMMRRFAGGDPEWAFAQVRAKGVPLQRSQIRADGPEGLGPIGGDDIQAMYGFRNGLTGYFASKTSSDTRGERFGVDLYGSKGVIAIRAGHVPKVWIQESAGWSGAAWKPFPLPEGVRPRDLNDAYHLMIDDLLAAIEADREPVSGGRNTRWTIEMVMAVYASHKASRPVKLPLERREHPLS